MNTNINTNVDFGTNNSNTNTTSSIRNTSNNSSPTYQNTYNTNGNVQTESMDLSFATEQVANESKSILDSIGDFFSDVGEGLKNTGAAIVDGAKTVANWTINGLKDLGSNIKEACTNLASNVTSILGSALSWAKDTYIDLQSTAAVIGTTVVSGLADIGEGIVDGLTWTGGKLIEGGSWLVGKVAGWFSDDAEEAVMEWRDQAKTDVKEFIAHDWVGEANDWFYQETALGRYINENSYLKYDSEAMQKLRGASEMVGKLVLATAATVVTGGAAAPIALGFLFGTGEQAEKLYQENPNTTGAQELGIFVSGIGEAANWYAQGKLGEGGLKLLNIIKGTGLKNTGAAVWSSFKSTLSNIKSNGFRTTLKGMLKNTNIRSVMATDNLADSIGIIGDNTSDWLVGNEELNLGNVLMAGGELLAAWGLNMFFDGASDYLSKLDDIKIKTEFPTTSSDLEITQPMGIIDDTSTIEEVDLDRTAELDVTSIRQRPELTPELQSALAKINTKSEINTRQIKQEILASVEGIQDPTLRAKKLYNELNKRVNYNVEYMDMSYSDVLPDRAVDIYQTKVSFDTLNGDQIICKGWSELYSELLIDAGFDLNQIRILGGQKIGAHKWVSVDLGNGYSIVADATNAIKGKTDLYSAKMGLTTQGFLVVSSDIIGTKAASPINFYKIYADNKTYLQQMNEYVKSLDSALGYADEVGYEFDQLLKAKETFSDSGLVDEVISENMETYVAMNILNHDIPSNVDIDGLEAYVYHNDMIRNILGRDYRGKITNSLYRSTSSITSEALNVVTINADNGPIYHIYSKSAGKIIIDSYEQFAEFISSFTRIY